MKAALPRVGGLLLVLILTAACGGSASTTGTSAPLTVRDDGAGGVTVEATWVTSEHLAARGALQEAASRLPDGTILIHVKLDTHSVDLAQYDLAALASLDFGGEATPALGYEPLSDEGHHREGVLAFAAREPEGPVSLVLREVAGVRERRLVWSAVPAD